MEKQNGKNDETNLSEIIVHHRYRGILKRRFSKKFQEEKCRFIDYIYTMASSMSNFIFVTRMLFCIQLLSSSFTPDNTNIWPNNNVLSKIMQVFSIFGNLAPSGLSEKSYQITSIVFLILWIAFFILHYFFMYYYLKYSKLQKWLITYEIIALNCISPWITNFLATFFARYFYCALFKSSAFNISLAVIYLIFYIHAISFCCIFSSSTLSFRPHLIPAFYTRILRNFVIAISLQNALQSLSASYDGWYGGIICISAVIPGGWAYYYTFKDYYWSSPSFQEILNSICFESMVISVVIGVFQILKVPVTEYIVVAFIFVYVIYYLISKLLRNKFKFKLMTELDELAEDIVPFENYNFDKTLNVLYNGFISGHPLCHKWTLFDSAEQRYSASTDLLIMWARFAAIYSEETREIKMIATKLHANKKHNRDAKYILFQIQSLLQQRERTLSKILKRHLNKLQDKVEKARGQVRYIWECIIRGSIMETESLASSLKNTIDICQRDYIQLSTVYPNNPSVAHTYALFLDEIVRDKDGAAEQMNNYKELRRGSKTRAERFYFFASAVLPQLPTENEHSLMIKSDAENEQHDVYGSMASYMTSGHNDDPNEHDPEDIDGSQMKYLETMIDAVRLPTMTVAPFLIFFITFIMVTVCIIPFVVIYEKNMPINQGTMKTLLVCARLRTTCNELVFYSSQFGIAKLMGTKSLKERFEAIGGDPNKLPKTWESDDNALKESVQSAYDYLKQLNMFIPTVMSIPEFEDAIQFLYQPSFNVSSISNIATGKKEYDYMSFTHYLVNHISRAVSILERSDSLMDSLDFFTIIRSSEEMNSIFDTFENIIVEEIQSMFDNQTRTNNIILIALEVVNLLIGISICLYLGVRMHKEKFVLFSSFKTLPKSSISQIVQKLNAQSGKDINSSENSENNTMSAQEENAIRILSTSSSSKMDMVAVIIDLAIPILIAATATIVAFQLLITIPENTNTNLRFIAPLIRDVMKIESLASNLMECEFRFAVRQHWSSTAPENYSAIIRDYLSYIMEIAPTAASMFLGNVSEGYKGIAVIDATKSTQIATGNQKEDVMYSPENIEGLILDSSFETSTNMVRADALRLYCRIMANAAVNPDEIEISETIYWLSQKIIDMFVYETFSQIAAGIDSDVNSIVSKMFYPCIAMLVIIMVCGIILMGTFHLLGDIARWSLRLLMFCQVQTVLNSKAIMKILSNDFSSSDEAGNEGKEKASFYEMLVSNILDAVVITTNDLTIHSVNPAVLNVLGIEPSAILGKNLKDILTAPPDREGPLHTFFVALDSALACLRPPTIELEVDVRRDNDAVTLQMNVIAVSTAGEVQTKPISGEGLAMFAVTMKDMTSTIAARTLLEEERKKGEDLLLMILPRTIVDKLQRGEQNISFSVQSASIMFVDIVSFTPWCGSLPAQTVMSTLNKLFAIFDRLLSKYDRMLKIKCIGDCYMAAGGIFDEVNQPAIHAIQAISFGLDMISALELFNVENKTSLRIRVGINCDGPITAGVLGIEKPTFDILGPAISMAAAMEHNGVPMNVHIPQHMYDLVYAEPFMFKERGEVEIKGKKIKTYLVTGYDQR